MLDGPLMVSLIIPVYNTKKYVKRLLDSVIKQSYQNWEAILIDDGSTDGSGLICDEYASNDSRFKVFHKENGGVSSARNLGLTHVSGDYITFCDSDDYCYPEMLEKLVNASEMGAVDIVLAKTMIQKVDGTKVPSRLPDLLPGKYASETIINGVYNNRLGLGLVDKLWKSNLFDGLKFTEKMVRAEDAAFAFDLYRRAKSMAVIEGAYYLYFRYRDGNSSTSKSKLHSFSPMLYCERLYDVALTEYPDKKSRHMK